MGIWPALEGPPERAQEFIRERREWLEAEFGESPKIPGGLAPGKGGTGLGPGKGPFSAGFSWGPA